MRRQILVLGFATLGLVVLGPDLGNAQSTSRDVQLYAGYLIGDRLLERPLSGSTPRLDDDATYGGRYTYHFTDQWGVQLSAGYSPNRAAHVVSGATTLEITTVDLDLEWDVPVDFQLVGRQLTPYTVIGAGYAWARLDDPMKGLVASVPVSISDSNGYTANAGLGAKYSLVGKIFADFESRYRFVSRLVNNFGQGSNTVETTLSVGYQF
jgi:opacity protein-like surface antigen